MTSSSSTRSYSYSYSSCFPASHHSSYSSACFPSSSSSASFPPPPPPPYCASASSSPASSAPSSPSSLPKLAIEGNSVEILRTMVAAKRRSVEIERAEDLQKLSQVVREHNDKEEHTVSLLRSMVDRKSSMIESPLSSPVHPPSSQALLHNSPSTLAFSPPPSPSSAFSHHSHSGSPLSSPSNASLASPYLFWGVFTPSSAYLIILHHESKIGVQLGISSRYGSFKYQDHAGGVFLCAGSGPPQSSDLGFVNFSASHSAKSIPGRFADFRIQTNSTGFLIQHKASDAVLKLTASAIVYRDVVLASIPVALDPNFVGKSISALRIDTGSSTPSDEIPGMRDRNRAIMRGKLRNASPSREPPPPPPLNTRHGYASHTLSSPLDLSPSPRNAPTTPLSSPSHSSSSRSSPTSTSSQFVYNSISPTSACSPSAITFSASSSSNMEPASSADLLRELTSMRDRLIARAASEQKGHHRRGDSEVPRMLQRLHAEVAEAEPSARLIQTMETLQTLLKSRNEEEAVALQKLMDLQRQKSAEQETADKLNWLVEGRGASRSASFTQGMRPPSPSLHSRQLSFIPRAVRAKGPVDDMFRTVTSTRRGCFQFGCDNRGRMHELVWHPTKLDGVGPEPGGLGRPQLKDADGLSELLDDAEESLSKPLPMLRPSWSLLKYPDRWGELMSAKEWKQQSEQPYVTGATETMKLTAQWHALLADWPKHGIAPSKSHVKKMKTLASRGIPNHLRGQVWFRFSGALAKMENNRMVYDELSRLRADELIEIQLRKDITRTYPNHVMFRNVDGVAKGSGNGQEDNMEVYSAGQLMLFKVLKNLALRNPHVGYCQGMGFSCALFLMYMPEEAAFWTMHQVLLADKYSRVADLYADGFPLLFQAFHILERLAKKFVPKLHDYFQDASLTTMTYATKWFQMIYAEFPRELVVAIWDIFLCEGWRILYRVAIAILLIKEKHLLSANPMELLEIVHDLPQDPIFRDTHTVMSTVLKVDITAKELKKLEMEYDAELASRPATLVEGTFKTPQEAKQPDQWKETRSLGPEKLSLPTRKPPPPPTPPFSGVSGSLDSKKTSRTLPSR